MNKAKVRTDHTAIKGYVQRVAKLVEEQKAIGADISDVCKEAKENAGLEPAMLRFVARESLMDSAKRAERDDKRHQYLHALGLAVAAVESGEMSARQAAKIYSIGKSSIYKELAVHDVSAAEMMTADDLGTAERVREMTADDLGDPLLVIDKERGRFRDKIKTLAASIKVPTIEAPTLNPDADADSLEFPVHLDRRVHA